jgi:hypothetical protein
MRCASRRWAQRTPTISERRASGERRACRRRSLRQAELPKSTGGRSAHHDRPALFSAKDRFWRKADVRGPNFESAAEAKRSLPNARHEAPLSSGPRLSRAQTGSPQPCPRLQLSKWTNPSFTPGEGSTYLFTSTLRGLLADRNLALASCYVSIAAIESRRSRCLSQ